MIDTACGSYAWSISGQVYTTSGIYVSTSINSLGCIQTDSLILSIICYDCNGDPNGTAFIDSCGNCVGGNTGNVACIPFSPNVVVTLSNTDCDSLTDLTVSVSQDPNEPDMSTALFVSDGGSFAISMMSVGDTIGSAFMSANSGNNTFTTVLIVSSILSNNQAIIQSQDINTGLVLGSFTISNTSPGISIFSQSPIDNNNVTSGNSSVVTFSDVFLNPGQSLLTFSTTINSELGDVDTQSFPFSIICLCAPNDSSSSVTACDSYIWDGVTYTTSGTYSNIYTDVLGCDSVHTLNLTINSSNTGSSSVTACDSYTWDGVTYTTSGAYTNTYTNAAGCDSVHTLTLTINNSTSSSMIDTACGSYAWSISGQVYTTSGIYVSTSINSLGCIQTDSLILSIICYDCNGDPNGTAFIDSCGNCVGGNTGNVACIPFSPNVVVTLSNTDCDSLTDLTVSVSQDPNEPDMSTALFVSDGGSFAISMMSVGDTIGYYSSAVMSANSGNNTFTTVLIVSSILSNNQAIIQSQDINTGLVLGSFTISNTSPGISIFSQSPIDNNNVTSGNSSVVTFSNVFLNPGQSLLTFSTTINSELGDVDTQSFPFSIICLCAPNDSSSSVTACDSYIWDGVTYTTSGTYSNIYTDVLGCDSVHTLTLTINSSNTGSSSVTACDSYIWDGVVYTTSGAYTNTYTNAAGCDSVHTLTLTINSSNTGSSSATACDSYTWDGVVYTTSGAYTNTYTNVAGCDSVHTLTLTINSSNTGSSSVTACDSYIWDGVVYTTSGTYSNTYTNAAGCDSVHTLNLTINSSNTGSSSVTACDSYIWDGVVYTTSGTYSNTYSNTYTNVQILEVVIVYIPLT